LFEIIGRIQAHEQWVFFTVIAMETTTSNCHQWNFPLTQLFPKLWNSQLTMIKLMNKLLVAVQVFSNTLKIRKSKFVKLLSHTHFPILEHNLLKIIFYFYFYTSKRLYNSVSRSPWLPLLLNTPTSFLLPSYLHSQPSSSLLTVSFNFSP